MDSKLIKKLLDRKKEGTIRSLSNFEGFIDFFSNDYLGLSELKVNSSISIFGATGSRLISGNSRQAIECEQKLSDFFESESALVFNSGYDANLGLFSSVPQKGDTIIYDEYIHASVRDGIRLSNANSFSFKHNSIIDLRTKLRNSAGTIYVAVESLYSMEGDIAPLKQIADLVSEFSAYLIVDEAHSCGVFGKDGRGIVDALELNDQVFARIITFGKAYGSHGACVLGKRSLIDYLINFARSFIYTTALPPSEYHRINQIIELRSINDLQKSLHDNISYFRGNLKSNFLISEINSPIQILRIGEISKTKHISDLLLNKNIAVKPIFSPTVKSGMESIRICIHSFNTKDEIDSLIEVCKTA